MVVAVVGYCGVMNVVVVAMFLVRVAIIVVGVTCMGCIGGCDDCMQLTVLVG